MLGLSLIINKSLLILTLSFQLHCFATAFWNKVGYFDGYVIHYISAECKPTSNWEHIFQIISKNNINSPLIVDLIPNWNFSESRYDLKSLINKTSSQPKYLQKVILLIHAHTTTVTASLQAKLDELFFSMATLNENPDYVFIYSGQIGSFKIKPSYDISSKFIFLVPHENYKVLVCTPCIPCDNNLHLSNCKSVDDDQILEGFDRDWNKFNYNLQSKVVTYYNANQVKGVFNNECGSNLHWFNYHHRDCGLTLLGIRHNFTPISIKKYSANRTKYGAAFGGLYLGLIGSSQDTVESFFFSKSYKKYIWHIYGNEFYTFKFAIITQYPRTFSGPEALISPFDWMTWTLLLVSIILMVVLIKAHGGFSVLNAMFWSISTILNQDGGKLPVASKRSAVIWVSSWYFVCFLLTTFYQGDISSALIAKLPPSVPQTLQQLLDSGINILTTSTVSMSKNGKSVGVSEIIESIIPSYLDSLAESSELYKFYSKLQQHLAFSTSGHGYGAFGNITTNISNSLPVQLSDEKKSWIDTKGMIAMLDYSVDLEHFIQSIEFNGKRLIVQNNANIPFILTIPIISERNFISQQFSKTLSALDESGIYNRWLNLYELQLELEIVNGTTQNNARNLYSLFYGKKMAEFKGGFNVLEKEAVVSLQDLKSFFVMCMGSALLGLIPFILEMQGRKYRLCML